MKILSAILESIRGLNPLTTLAASALTLVITVFNFFNVLWAELLTKLAALALPPATAVSVMQGFSFINYVFPVTELFTFCSAFMVLYLVCAAIRIVKAFLPTIS